MNNLSALSTQFGLLIIGCPPLPPSELPKQPLPAAVPLKRVSLKGTITHPNIARLTLSQEYENENGFPVTAVYKFPVEADVAVCGFQADIVEQDGRKRTVKGTVKERKQAASEYKEATSKGQGAYLVESEKDDVFQISVGNLGAKCKTTITLTYISALHSDLSAPDTVRFLLPTTIGSGTYGESVLKPGSGIMKGTPPTVDETGVELEVEITVKVPADSVVEAIESPSHPISVTNAAAAEDGFASSRITFANPSSRLNRDFILLLRLPSSDKPTALFQFDPVTNAYAGLISLVPRFALDPSSQNPKELVFVIDRSGSMEGSSITHAKEALLLMLRSLPADAGVSFNIVSFGSSFSSLWPEAKAYNEASMKEAEKEVEKMGADMGGTEMLQPIQAILEGTLAASNKRRNNSLPPKTKRDDKAARSIMILTDGEIWNTADLLHLVSTHAKTSDTRVFTLGIGGAVSTHLVKGIARCGNGIAEFVGDGERMEKKVIKLVKIALADGVRDLNVDWGRVEEGAMDVDSKPPSYSADVKAQAPKKLSFFSDDPMPEDEPTKPKSNTSSFQQAPHLVPPLYASSRYTICAFLRSPGLQGGQPPTTVKLSGKVPQGDMELEIPVTLLPPAIETDRTVHILAAKRLLQDLSESASYMHDPVSGDLASGYSQADLTKEMVRLGTTFQLASTETSWIAVDPETKVEVESVRELLVPQERERSSGMGYRGRGRPMMASAMPMTACAAMPAPRSGVGFLSSASNMLGRMAAPMRKRAMPPPFATEMAAPGSGFGGGRGVDAAFAFDMAAAAPAEMMEDEAEMMVSKEESQDKRKRGEKDSGKPDKRQIFSQLIKLQQFNGSWADAKAVASACGIAFTAAPAGVDASVWATLLAVSYLENKLGEFKDEWELVVDKARRWLDGKAADAPAWSAAAKAVA